MNTKEHNKDFNRRWNIPSSEVTPEEAFNKFKQRILNIFNSVKIRFGQSLWLIGIDSIITDESALDFCQSYSISEKLDSSCRKITIIDRLINENDEKEFYRLIERVVFLKIKKGWVRDREVKQFLIKKVKEAVEISDINVAVKESNGGIMLYPKGEEKLDEELVNKSLSFLNKESNKHFEEALKLYQKKEPIKSAESLRRSLEEFLRYKLKNTAGLKNNISTLQKNLKNNSASETRNIIVQVFNYLDKYFNEHSKHGDGNINEPENEFLIYQTGLLMRYINKVAKTLKNS